MPTRSHETQAHEAQAHPKPQHPPAQDLPPVSVRVTAKVMGSLAEEANLRPEDFDVDAEGLQVLAQYALRWNSRRLAAFVAEHPNTSPETLRYLLASPANLGAAATRKALSRVDDPALLQAVFKSDGHRVGVREGLAGNPHTPGPLINKILAKEHLYVYIAAAANPALPVEAQRRLSLLQKSERIREADRQNVLCALAKNPSLDPDVARHLLGVFLQNRDMSRVCFCLAQNPSCTPDVLEAIFDALGDREVVKRHLAKNPNTPEGLLSVLALSEVASVAQNAARNLLARRAVGL